jgi:DNA-binding NarL/FixJ family response regulator
MHNTSIKLAIIDDHQIVVDGLIAALKTYPFLEVVVTANKAEDMLAALPHNPVDVLLTDVMMPGVSGQALAKEVRLRFPHIRLIALSMSGNGTVVEEMINDADIAGYLLKQSTVSELVQAIEKVHNGGIYFQDYILTELSKLSNRKKEVEETRLTPRERQIIALIEKDFSNKQIADHLFIAVRTVETHRKSIFKKTGTNNALALVKWAYDHQLL